MDSLREKIPHSSIHLILCDYGLFKSVSLEFVFGFPSFLQICAGVIIITTQILSLGLRKLRQPRVIAEVLGGILLGAPAI